MDRQDWRSLVAEYGVQTILVAVVGFMFWVRTLDAEQVIKEDVVYFTAGNDPWYHARIVNLVVEHFPATQRFDPFSYFPYGTGRHSGFGGLFDQVIALAAMIVGGGSPSPRLVDITTAVAPAAFGALTAIPVYLVTKRIYDRWTGAVAAGLLALFSGGFLTRTVIGVADHQSSEAFFATFAVLGFLLAVLTAYREKPTVADLRDRNWIVLRRPVIASLLGGVGIGAYLMAWGPGVMLVFTMGIFAVLQSFRDHLRGRPIEYLVFGTAGSMAVAGVLTLLYAKSYELQATAFSLLQPLVCFGIAAGALTLYALATYLPAEDREDWYYPAATVGLIAGVLLLATLVYPRTIALMESLLRRVYSFGLLKSATALTVGELSPGSVEALWRSYGPVLFLSVWGLALLLARVVREDRPGELLLALWTITMISAYFTASRFGYYLAINAAILAGFAIVWMTRVGLDLDLDSISEVEPYQVMGVLIIVLLVVPGNVVAFGGLNPAWQTAEFASGADTSWQNELRWMRGNTPDLPMEYQKRYERPASGDFAYPEAAYGVMSWWDYGHWITKTARRAPFANPFQQGPRPASAYLQMRNETRANLLLEALPSMQSLNTSPYRLSTERLRSMIDDQSEQEASEDIRYVTIDDQMASYIGYRGGLRNPKFRAIATWTGPGPQSYISNEEVTLRQVRGGRFVRTNQTAQLPTLNDRFEDTMISELYFQDANGLSHYRLVHETNATATFLSIARGGSQGGFRPRQVGSFLTRVGLRVLQQPNGYAYNVRQESRIKTYERVEGATLTGRVDTESLNVSTNTTVTARLSLQTNAGRNFTYAQRTTLNADGSFSVTVPYATNDAVQPSEGGTDVGVEARGNYTIDVGGNLLRFRGQLLSVGVKARGSTEVPEQAIYEGASIEVELSEVQRNRSTGNGSTGNGTVGNTTTPNGSTPNGSTGNQSGDGQSSVVGFDDLTPTTIDVPDLRDRPRVAAAGSRSAP